MRLTPTLFNHKDELYLVIRAIPEDRFQGNMEALKACRDWLDAEHVLRYQGKYLFVEEIKTLDFSE